jgi:uncharacterized protein YkwD
VEHSSSYRAASLLLLALTMTCASRPPVAAADNQRLNNGVFQDIYVAQKQNGCPTEARLDPRLADAARRHSLDVRDDRSVDGAVGSDGSEPSDRARDAGFNGYVAETIAINPALAISGLQVLQQWWNDPQSRATMQDCRYTRIGVWSENSLDRTVVVAMYGQPF